MNRAECPAENTIAAFADGSLPPDDMVRVEAHAGTCVLCQQLLGVAVGTGAVGTFAAQPDGEQAGTALARGTTIGRYTILSLVGQGGMGEVYATYDPELDRKVALKLLRSDGARDAAAGHARLVREAKAMARVSHPNVVAVHDAGTFGARVFLAMEFVDGPTVRAWLAERPRARGEVLAVFVQAAQGLMAAHAAGLVHRDFKPANVMIARDGSVRVTDFGIARSFEETRDQVDGGRDLLTAGADVHQTLTATGQLLGTPLYMAPEQFRAAATDARTDQFSFCVALYQSLYGVAPFGEGNVASLAVAVLAGRVQPAPPKSSVPEWQRRVLLRGLSLSPEARWPSMRELVAALVHDPSRARRRWALTAGAALLGALPVMFVARHPEQSASLCRGGPARLAGAWEPFGPGGGAHPRRDTIGRAFLTSGAPGADEVWTRVAASLDRYTAGWLAMYEDACLATHVRDEQAAHVLDLRMSCLDERRTALGALTDIFAGADRGVVAKSVDAVDALPGLERCADVKGLASLTEPPRDEATRVRVADLRHRIATAKALHDAGKALAAVQARTRVVEDARASGYRPVLAEALALSGPFNSAVEGPEVALVLEDAIWTAIEVGRDDLAAMSAIGRTATCYFEPDLISTPFWLQLSRALLDRAGPGQERLRSWFLHDQALIKQRENDLPAALTLVRQAISLKEQILPQSHPDIAISQTQAAEILHAHGETEDALLLNQRAHDTFLAAYGPASIELAAMFSNRGEYLLGLGRPAEALVAAREGLSLWEAHMGLAHQNLAYPLTGMGRALVALGRVKEAVAPLERALRLRDPSHTNPSLVAETQFALAQALVDDGTAPPRALSLATKARDGYRGCADKTRADAVEAWLETRQRPRQAR